MAIAPRSVSCGIFLAALILLPIGGCIAGESESIQATQNGQKLKDVSGMCAEIQKRHENGTLKDIQVGSVTENFDKSFLVDFDNDGQEEEFKYFPLRTYSTLAEIVNGERRGFVNSGVQSASYSGNYILKLNEEFFVLHTATYGLLTLQRVTEMTPEEMKKRNMDPDVKPPVYNTEILCEF